MLECRPVAHLARDPRLIDIASRWLGATAIPFKATLFEKSPDANWLVSWHQDTALPILQRRDLAGWGPWSNKCGITYAHAPGRVLEKVMALRVHLDDSTADNGPLRVLPGSHSHGVLSDAQVHELAQRVSPPTVISNPPRDFSQPTTYFTDPDVISVDPLFDGYAQPNSAIQRRAR